VRTKKLQLEQLRRRVDRLIVNAEGYLSAAADLSTWVDTVAGGVARVHEDPAFPQLAPDVRAELEGFLNAESVAAREALHASLKAAPLELSDYAERLRTLIEGMR